MVDKVEDWRKRFAYSADAGHRFRCMHAGRGDGAGQVPPASSA